MLQDKIIDPTKGESIISRKVQIEEAKEAYHRYKGA